MTLCLISTTDSCNVTLSRTSVLAIPLESALPRNAPAKRLESALAKSLDLKSSEMNTCRKCGGPPLLCILPFTIFVCESVFISVHLWLHLLAFFVCLLYFLCPLYRPWRPIALVQLSPLGGGGGRGRGGGARIPADPPPGGGGRTRPSPWALKLLGEAFSRRGPRPLNLYRV